MKLELQEFSELENYPISSGIEFFDDKIYIIANSASGLLVMGKKWNNARIQELAEKSGDANSAGNSNLETMTVLSVDKKPHLLAVGSGMNADHSKGLLLNLKSGSIKRLDILPFYQRIKSAGIPELNIEGIAEVYDYMVMINRSTPSNPVNQLIITKSDFWRNQENATIQIVAVDFAGAGSKPGLKFGITGITYSDHHEDLFITALQENFDGGADSSSKTRSYLGVIENLYRKIGREKGKLKVNQLIDLSSTDEQFKDMRMESVAVQSEKDHSIKLQLIGDNPKKTTFLFKVNLKWG